MTFTMTSSNEYKSDICQFFYEYLFILSIQYMYKTSWKMNKHFRRYNIFFHRQPTYELAPPSHPLLTPLKKVLVHFLSSTSYLILASSLAPFPCLLSNWLSSCCKFSIIGLVSGLQFPFLQSKFAVLCHSRNSNIFFSGGIVRKGSSSLFKTRFGILLPVTWWREIVFVVFLIKKANSVLNL